MGKGQGLKRKKERKKMHRDMMETSNEFCHESEENFKISECEGTHTHTHPIHAHKIQGHG